MSSSSLLDNRVETPSRRLEQGEGYCPPPHHPVPPPSRLAQPRAHPPPPALCIHLHRSLPALSDLDLDRVCHREPVVDIVTMH